MDKGNKECMHKTRMHALVLLYCFSKYCTVCIDLRSDLKYLISLLMQLVNQVIERLLESLSVSTWTECLLDVAESHRTASRSPDYHPSTGRLQNLHAERQWMNEWIIKLRATKDALIRSAMIKHGEPIRHTHLAYTRTATTRLVIRSLGRFPCAPAAWDLHLGGF